MKVEIRNQPDFFAGALFMVAGTAFALAASSYDVGTAAQMGPGRFPMALGGLLALLGVGIMVHSMTAHVDRDVVEAVSLKTMTLVLGSVALFGILLQPLGMVAGSIILVLVSASASHEFHWRYAIIVAVTLVVVCYLIFVYGLGLPLPVLPWGR